MSNPVFFSAAGTLDHVVPGAQFVLQGPEARHAVAVKRLAPGESVDIADGAGKRLTGTVVAASPSELTVECSALTAEEKPDIRLVLVQALAKGDRDELAVETATELGIDAVIPWQSERSIVRWKGERAAKAHAKWQSVATAAAKQARRAWIPEVRAAVETPDWLQLPARPTLPSSCTRMPSGRSGLFWSPGTRRRTAVGPAKFCLLWGRRAGSVRVK